MQCLPKEMAHMYKELLDMSCDKSSMPNGQVRAAVRAVSWTWRPVHCTMMKQVPYFMPAVLRRTNPNPVRWKG